MRVPTCSRHFLAAVALVLVSTGARAGLSYTLTSRSEGEAGQGGYEMRLDVLVSGGAAKAVFTTPPPGMSAGSWLVTQDGGGKTLVVDPGAKTYSEFSAGQLQSDVAAMQKAMGPLKMRTENVKVEDLGEEDGGTIEGFPAKHHRFRVSYDRTMKLPMVKRSMHTVIEDELWTTSAVADAGTGIWKLPPPKVPDGEGAEDLAAAYGKAGGFLLKLSRKTSSTGGHGDRSSTETLAVTEVKKADVPPETFAIPAGFTETQGGVMRPQGGSQMPDLK